MVFNARTFAAAALCLSSWAQASTLYTGTGTAVHDSRNTACQNAERAARLDAARQAESYVRRHVRASAFENEHGLQQSRSDFIETTVYGKAIKQGEARERTVLLDNYHVECQVEARYRIDTTAIRQQLEAEQARVSRQTERELALANLHQELAENQAAWQALQQAMPAAPYLGSTTVREVCQATWPLAQCETVIGERIAAPYRQALSDELGLDSSALQHHIDMQGRTELSAINSQLNQANWQGSYQLRFSLSNPYAERNQQLARAIARQNMRSQQTDWPDKQASSSWRPEWLRFGVSYGSDCLACSTSTMSSWKSVNKTDAQLVRTNYLHLRLITGRWFSLNAGLYGENFVQCRQKGRGNQCAEIVTQNATLPALGISLYRNWWYFEAMQLFNVRPIALGEQTLEQGYQRYELGLTSLRADSRFTFELGIATRSMPATGQSGWNSTDLNLRLGYVF